MASFRLSMALESGAVTLPGTGRIALFRPRATHDLSALPVPRLDAIQGFFPEHRALVRAGIRTLLAPDRDARYSAAVVFLPRARDEAQALVARARDIAGQVIVDGQKTDGVDSMLKAIRRNGAQPGEVWSKAHGKVFSFTGGSFEHWKTPDLRAIGGGFVTAPGVFSADAPDPGSQALIAALPAGLRGRICDLGAGWGFLAAQVLKHHPGVQECHLVEAEHRALECARRNVADPRAHFHWADALDFRPGPTFDHVVTNPPFHTGRAADPGLGRGFIAAAPGLLRANGTLWLVANRHLPYEQNLSEAFAEVAEVAGDRAFKVFRARRPRQRRTG